MELAAAGVSIALFNQASRIFIFPLVSITTSFVAEEDTIERLNTKASEKQLTENIKTEFNAVTLEDHMLQDVEKGAAKENSECPKESLARNGGSNELIAKSSASAPESVDKYATIMNIDAKNGDGIFLCE